MIKERVVSAAVIALCLGILVFGMSSGKSLDLYVPGDVEEKQLIELIREFHFSRKDYDPKRYLSCLSGSGRFMFAGSPMLLKKDLEKRLPGFWADLKSGNMAARAFSRESLNGNFLDGDLYDPVIRIEGRKAHAELKFVASILRWTRRLFLDFEKTDGRWLISRLEWEMG